MHLALLNEQIFCFFASNTASATSATVIDGGLTGDLADAGTATVNADMQITSLDLAGGIVGDSAFAGIVAGAGAGNVAGQTDVLSGASLSGPGTINGKLTYAGLLNATGGKLLVTSAISSPGIVSAAASGTLDLAGGGTLTGVTGGAGTANITVAAINSDTFSDLTNPALFAGHIEGFAGNSEPCGRRADREGRHRHRGEPALQPAATQDRASA